MNNKHVIWWGVAAGFILTSWGCGGVTDVLPAADSTDTATAVIDSTSDTTTSDTAKVQPTASLAGTDCLALGDPESDIHKAMVDALNTYRVENGLQPLVYSKRLELAADGMTRDLWQRNFFAHINPDGQNPGDRAIAAGFCHKYVGENLAAGQRTVDAVMQAWKNSPGHNANMLESEYKYVGVSFSVDENGRLYWAQEFAYDVP